MENGSDIFQEKVYKQRETLQRLIIRILRFRSRAIKNDNNTIKQYVELRIF